VRVRQRQVEPVGQAIKKPLATTEEYGDDEETVLVNEAVGRQAGRQDRASDDRKILSWLLLHTGDDIWNIIRHDGRVGP
jgi:hypothetical protein